MKYTSNRFSRVFEKNMTKRWLFLAIILLVFFAIYSLNRLYPMMGEDWDYSFFWDNEGNKVRRINNFFDILITQYHHYILWGGRVITHGIVQVLLFMGKQWYDLFNSIAFVLLVYLIYKIINNRNSTNIIALLLVVFSLCLCLPDFATNTLWISYSGNYLWGTLIIVAFIYPFYSYYRNPDLKNNKLKSALMFFGGIFAGWTNENMSIALICFLIMLIFLLKRQKKPIQMFLLFGLLGVFIGCLMLILAPGNYLRLDESSINTPVLGIWEVLGKRLFRLYKNWFKYVSALSGIYLIILYIFTKKCEKDDKLRIKQISLLFFIAAYIGLIVMTPLPEFSSRTLFGAVVFLIIAIGILFCNIPYFSLLYKKVCYFTTVILLIVSCFTYGIRYKYIKYLHDVSYNREIFLDQQKSRGIEDIVFSDSIKPKRGFIIYEFSKSADDWPNTIYAKYYGVRSVQRK